MVDAGGKGFLVILSGMLSCLRGEPMPEGADEDQPAASIQDKADFESIDTESITFAFDTVYIVRKKSETVDLAPLRAYLDSIGDSLVIGEDDESFKVHVHTNIPGEALTESQKYGTLELAKIENMRTQHDDLAAGRHVQRVQTIWIRSKKSWKAMVPSKTASGTSPRRKRNMVSSPSVPATESPVCSGIWAATASSAAARR